MVEETIEDEVSLLSMVQSMDQKQKLNPEERTNISKNRNAFAIGGVRRLHVSALTQKQNLGGKEIDASLKKQTNKILRKQNIFETPLEKKETQKANRKMYYDQTVKTLEKWDDSVKRFKVAPQTDLRNVNEKINIVPTEARSRKLGTELEKELDAILHGSEYIPDEGEELSRAEKNILNSVSIEEAAMRRIELQKHRHLQSQYQTKARRMRKIKSKTFHRHLKKRNEKEDEKQEKEQEEVEDKLIKDRAVDRATLKHSSTGSKWSKKVKRLAWKDDDLQKSLNAQNDERELKRQRIEKGIVHSDDSEEDAEEEPNEKISKVDAQKIINELGGSEWLKVHDTESEILANIESAIENNGKVVTEGFGILNLPQIATVIESQPEVTKELAGKEKELVEMRETRKKRKAEVNSDDESDQEKPVVKPVEKRPRTLENMTKNIAKKQKLDSTKVIEKAKEIKIDINSVLNKVKGGESNATIMETEDTDGATTTIREAFADDDIIKEFQSAKREKQNEEKGKVIDLIMPGFDGTWAGEDFKPTKTQKRRFRLKQKTAPRLDRNLGHVIISEKNKSLEKMRVENLPFPYQNKAQFEKAISQPIGQTWNTSAGFREMTAPPILTVPGQIIKPAQMEKEKRLTDIFTVTEGDDKQKKQKAKLELKQKYKRGRRKTAADDLSLSAM